ncbi:hypothetical protein HYPSUDRAFT_212277 [Hypholoma sublateritium FD-334 SS-4]|uniref:Uncharacterized protein n=1 Tax=Hypholoma sublateritium (strain FD-334 SS-4) TaxID=945553 RepID=A0A0D2PGR9_HYPSF|nr:hypothetical protein HYPSUDRAFT_212277 [Hypholoma sublateritium FD-334 SS-4]
MRLAHQRCMERKQRPTHPHPLCAAPAWALPFARAMAKAPEHAGETPPPAPGQRQRHVKASSGAGKGTLQYVSALKTTIARAPLTRRAPSRDSYCDRHTVRRAQPPAEHDFNLRKALTISAQSASAPSGPSCPAAIV